MRYIKWRRLSAVICISAMAASAIDVMALPAVEKGSYGVPEETAAFRKVAPWDFVFNDPNTYDTQQYGSIELDKVDETASVRWRSVFFNGSHMGTPYLARTGHLIASRHKTGSNPVPEAAIFYTSYTRDGLPAKDRPVTFMWNGGPGSSSIWLHLGSWAPKRLKSDAPNIANDAVWPQEFPFEANAITLLDQTDLVFVDPPGTGLSTAIAPNVNNTFWGTDSDAQVIADFITAYINK